MIRYLWSFHSNMWVNNKTFILLHYETYFWKLLISQFILKINKYTSCKIFRTSIFNEHYFRDINICSFRVLVMYEPLSQTPQASKNDSNSPHQTSLISESETLKSTRRHFYQVQSFQFPVIFYLARYLAHMLRVYCVPGVIKFT